MRGQSHLAKGLVSGGEEARRRGAHPCGGSTAQSVARTAAALSECPGERGAGGGGGGAAPHTAAAMRARSARDSSSDGSARRSTPSRCRRARSTPRATSAAARAPSAACRHDPCACSPPSTCTPRVRKGRSLARAPRAPHPRRTRLRRFVYTHHINPP